MNRIFRYRLEITDAQVLRVPRGCKPLTAQVQNGGALCLWVMVDDSQPDEDLAVYVVGTGNPFPDDAMTYVASVQMPPFVWHVFVKA